MARTELTKQEQANVRAALRVLKARDGGLAVLAARMGASAAHLKQVLYGIVPSGAATAIRVAQTAGASVEDVLSGRFPGPGVCRHCGHAMDAPDVETPDVH